MTTRRALPPRRYTETFKLAFWGQTWHVNVGHYEDRDAARRAEAESQPLTPGEVFIAGGKAGTQTESTARDGAILLSLAMQYGAPLDVIRHALTREEDGKPSSLIGAVVDRMLTNLDVFGRQKESVE